MAETEAELRQQEMERDSLQRTVSGLQGALMYAKGEQRSVLETALRNASGHLGTVEKRVKDLQVTHEAEARVAETQAAAIAAQETRLNAQEKETFAGFMKKDFFTRADFGRLDEFYKKSYDRLSEHGKDEMSHRIWEGIRKGSYAFGELPPDVREKEAKRAYGALKKQSELTADVSKIPEKDRDDFTRAYETGKIEEAEKILERPGFKKNMFRGVESKKAESVQVQIGREAEGKAAGEAIAASKAGGSQLVAGKDAGKAKESLRDLNFHGAKLVESASPPSSGDVPRAGTGPVKSVPSLGGG